MNIFKVLRIVYPISIILFWGLSIKFYPDGVPQAMAMILVFYSLPALALIMVGVGAVGLTIICLLGLFLESIITGENKFKEL